MIQALNEVHRHEWRRTLGLDYPCKTGSTECQSAGCCFWVRLFRTKHSVSSKKQQSLYGAFALKILCSLNAVSSGQTLFLKLSSAPCSVGAACDGGRLRSAAVTSGRRFRFCSGINLSIHQSSARCTFLLGLKVSSFRRQGGSLLFTFRPSF